LERSTVFVHITDTHFRAPGDETYARLGIDPLANFERMQVEVERFWVRPAFFVVTGDLVALPTAEAYAVASEQFGALGRRFGVPVLLGLGNHDDRTNFRRVVLDEEIDAPANWNRDVPGVLDDGTMPGDPWFYARTVAGLRVVMLDTSDYRFGAGNEQLNWLEAELAEDHGVPRLVFMHGPIQVPWLPQSRRNLTSDAQRLVALLRDAARAGKLVAVLCGDVHQSSLMLEGGLLNVVTPSITKLFDRLRAPVRPYHHPPGVGFAVCSVAAEQLSVHPYVISYPLIEDNAATLETRVGNARRLALETGDDQLAGALTALAGVAD
jgi:Icc protein